MIKEEVIGSTSQIKSYAFCDIDRVMLQKWGEKWTKYRKRWVSAGQIRDVKDVYEMPLYVLTELNSFCNLRCKMCKHAEDTNDLERLSMPVEMFRKIVAECRVHEVPSFNVGYGTECTLHPGFESIIQEIKNSGCIDKFFLSNGTTLFNNKILDSIFYGDFERVEISVDAATPETYNKIRRNGNYEKLEIGINNLIKEKQLRNSLLPIIRLSFCVQDDNVNEIDMFYDKWKDKVDIIEFQKMEVQIEETQKKSNKFCSDPFNRVTIDYSGEIYPCCSILYQNEYSIGNINESTIYEAWHGDRMNELRNSLVSGKLMEHCNKCLLSIYGE